MLYIIRYIIDINIFIEFVVGRLFLIYLNFIMTNKLYFSIFVSLKFFSFDILYFKSLFQGKGII